MFEVIECFIYCTKKVDKRSISKITHLMSLLISIIMSYNIKRRGQLNVCVMLEKVMITPFQEVANVPLRCENTRTCYKIKSCGIMQN